MRLSTRSRYALRLMIYLARQDRDQIVMLKKISEEEEISDKYLSQLIIPLRKYGLIRSFRGAKGGYALAKAPEAITIEDIVSVMEDGTEVVACVKDAGLCERSEHCTARRVWEKLGMVFAEYLRTRTLYDIIESETTDTSR